ncbi:hypothetical protein PV327_010824 [Microctonus hyperodae]|nr:hypothetical protein PV327_010824 [Microctonus hyperodae]
MRLTKRIDEVRLLESRKSARLADQDTDFARLADMAGDRKRASSHSIDVPHVPGSRKRRPSSSNDSERSYNGWPLENYARIGHRCGREGCRTNERGDCMDECTAALVLMSLSCSPHSPHHSLPLNCPNGSWMGQGGDNAVMGSPGNGGTSNSSSSDVSWRSGTPSPQLSEEGAPVATSTWPTSNNPNVGVRSVANNNNININNNNSDHCNASTSHHQLNSSYNVSGSSPGSTPNSSGTFDEGIVTDYLEEMHPKKKKRELQNQTRANHHLMENDVGYNFERSIPAVTTLVFKCTWPGCTEIKTTCPLIEEHVRQSHLGPKKTKAQSDDDDCDMSDHEEEFYYQEIAVNHMSSPPTMSHRDMARPPHEDPEYQKQLRLESSSAITTTATTTTTPANSEIVSLNSSTVGGASSAIINNKERLFNFKVSPIRPRSPATPIKHMKHSSRHNHQAISMLAVTTAIGKIASSPRRVRGDTKKCRKIYGMENREQWCTQCKWKKACVRFAE